MTTTQPMNTVIELRMTRRSADLFVGALMKASKALDETMEDACKHYGKEDAISEDLREGAANFKLRVQGVEAQLTFAPKKDQVVTINLTKMTVLQAEEELREVMNAGTVQWPKALTDYINALAHFKVTV